MRPHLPALLALASSLALVGCGTQEATTGAAAPTVPATPTAPAPEPAASATPADAAPTSPAPTSPSPSTTAAAEVEPPSVDADCGPFDDPEVLARAAESSLLDAMREDPRLDGFVSALTGELDPSVDLSGALGGGPFTVLAPVDATYDGLDAATTSFLLSYHLVPGEGLTPEQLVDQTRGDDLETLQGWGLTVFGDAAAPQVSEDGVAVLCGGVQTAGGTLYVLERGVHPAGDYVAPGSTLPPPVPATGAPSR